MTLGCPQGTAFGPLLYNDNHRLYAAGETRGTVESRLKTQGHLVLV